MIVERKIKVTRSQFFILVTFLIFIPSSSFGQRNTGTIKMEKISCPEKWWAIFHPFIAKKAYKLTREALKSADSLQRTEVLDGDISGGQVDAFKHSYWMALLAQQFRWQKVWKLGRAHEKGNYRSFKKAIKHGNESSHDKISSDMDLWNNREGIKIGLSNQHALNVHLQSIIIDSIQEGTMRIIKKNGQGDFLDRKGNIIPENDLTGKWENSKCLVPSDYRDKNDH